MTCKFGRIGVLAGGPSSEREISLRSGKAVHDALLAEKLDASFLDVGENIRDVIKQSGIDIAFIALHGKFGEDGTVQKLLEELAIPYTGSGVEASALALDKAASKEVFIKNRIPVPKYVVLKKGAWHLAEAKIIGLPIVVKPHLEGSSIGLSIVRDAGMLKAAVDKAFEYGEKVVLEEYIDGRELTVGVLGEEPLPVIEIVTRDNVYDYSAKYLNDDTKYLVPAPIEKNASDNAQRLGALSHKALGCRSFSRVDMIMKPSGEIFVLEVNTIPGMTERSLLPKAAAACGLRFGELCVRILENALARSA